MPTSPTSLGITFPCSNAITVGDFSSQALTVEAALSAANALIPPLMDRDFVKANAVNPNVAVNVNTTVSWTTPTAANNPNGLFNPASPTLFTLQSSGSYLATLHVSNLGFPTTFTSIRGAILLNGVEQVWESQAQAGTATGGSFWASGPLVSATAGQQVTCTWLWTGTGGPIQPLFDFQLCKISDL